MLPARYRMTRSTEFGATVKRGMRVGQPDLVVHVLRMNDSSGDGPRIGLVVAKSVGNAVQRHRVSRRLRHVAGRTIGELYATDRIVIRALPGSSRSSSARLEKQLRTALHRIPAQSAAAE